MVSPIGPWKEDVCGMINWSMTRTVPVGSVHRGAARHLLRKLLLWLIWNGSWDSMSQSGAASILSVPGYWQHVWGTLRRHEQGKLQKHDSSIFKHDNLVFQVTIQGFESKGFSKEQMENLLANSVETWDYTWDVSQATFRGIHSHAPSYSASIGGPIMLMALSTGILLLKHTDIRYLPCYRTKNLHSRYQLPADSVKVLFLRITYKLTIKSQMSKQASIPIQ